MLRNAPLGEFEARLRLVRSAALYARRAYLDGARSSDRVARVLYNLHRHYAQHLPMLTRRMAAARAPLQAEMKKTARLARWVDARKAASDKGSWAQLHDASNRAHRALHKVSVLLFTVIFNANHAHNLTRSP
jgi:hypothetical protein